ncbi:hypothetical protein ACJ73_07348 [Blastomyces percursus]|uniref:Aminoglycoside phosphotransferase domain-containing protein n=1 Tax=Blastomyces percursus TaxID=1658174 RepID=A0A1J9QYP1_9EURO|nr:hypothetical protein ACJ73_07348 [Blastomyces percursus]
MNSPKLKENPLLDPLFNHTSGRWLWDEAAHLRKRHQPFNVDGLKAVASKAVNARSCTSITKLSEGSYNKVYLLVMDNGVQVVARIPNPYLPPRVSTASEVATLDFLRTELDIPVPRVLAWSSKKDQLVGAEYIVMEMAPGEELGKSWMSMDISEKVNIVPQLANIQARACSVDFKSYGSLYYRDDVDGCQDIPSNSDRFCIGPAAAISFWEAEREAMDKYRGPWTSPESYAKDIARREMDWIRRYAKSRDHSDPLKQSTSQESPDCHIQLLDKYLKIVPLVLPSDVNLYRSTIWHPDLHSGNIFIKNSKILPKFLRINGPLLFDLPPAASIAPEERKETLLRYEHTQLQKFYISRLKNLDPHIFQAISYPHAIIRQQLINFAGSTWEDDGLFFLREMMHNVWRDWNEITSSPNEKCPITFESNEISSHVAEGKFWDNYKAFFDSIDIPLDGWVHPEDFKSKAAVMQNLAKEMLDSAEDRNETRQALKAWKLSDPNSTSLCSKVMDI